MSAGWSNSFNIAHSSSSSQTQVISLIISLLLFHFGCETGLVNCDLLFTHCAIFSSIMTGRPRGRPRAKPLLSQDSSSISENISPISAESSLSSLLSSRDSSSSVSAASSYESVATVIHPSLSLVEDQVQQIEPLPPTPPRARSTASAQVEQLKQLAEEAKANDLDPTVLMFAQLLSNQSRPRPDKSSPLSKPIGEHKQGEDIFVFLHRFEYQMKLRHIPPINWLHYLPDLLIILLLPFPFLTCEPFYSMQVAIHLMIVCSLSPSCSVLLVVPNHLCNNGSITGNTNLV